MPLSPTTHAIIALAREAGRLARAQSGRIDRLTKRGAEAVTEADRACQRLIVSGLRARFPDDGIIGEEDDTGAAITHDRPRAGERTWVIDPIDGTNNFIAGFGNYAVCIGLIERGQPVLGVVHDPSRDHVYAAARGEGAWLDETQIRALDTALSPRSLLMMTSNCLVDDGRLPGFATRWLRDTTWKLRMLGSAALEAVQVAAGIAHGAVTINGKLWDCAAPAAIVIEAGGRFTGPRGETIFPYDLTGYAGAKVPFVAAGPAAHAELVSEIAGNW